MKIEFYFKKNRIDELEQQRNSVKAKNNAFATSERLKSLNPDWKTQMLIHRNELCIYENILKDAAIVD